MYVSNFDDWYERASVRTKPRRILLDEEAEGKVYFPVGQMPILSHPLVRERGPGVARALMVQKLYRYLDFTAHLEHHLVNSAAQKIAFRQTDFDLPGEMLFDAHKLYTDEAYHALFSEDLKLQVVATTKMLPLSSAPPEFLNWLRVQQASHPPEWSGLLEIYSAVVAETLISATLVQLPRDPTVITTVRELVADHAEDEAIHHRFFAQLFRMTWPMLSEKQKAMIGPKLAHFMVKFLLPDLGELRTGLVAAGLDPVDAEQVLDESHSSRGEIMEGVRRTARMTLRLFEQCGLWQDSRIRDSFEREELLVSSADEDLQAVEKSAENLEPATAER